jgi:AmmeMemoRadiSam system protein B
MIDQARFEGVRPSPIAGTWYPGTREQLAQTVDQFLEMAGEQGVNEEDVIGVIVPHAGHRYSGQVASFAFRCLENLSPEIVAVVSPMHMPVEGKVITTGHEAYETPLGTIPVHQVALQELREALWTEHKIYLEQIRHDSEHSLEIELPFLQRLFTSPFYLLPIMLRDQGQATVEALGHVLGDLLRGESAILVASSDLSHFYSETLARQLDSELLSRLENFDPAGVLSAEDEGLGFACGRGAIAAVLWATRDLGADAVKVLHHATSGDVTSDYSSVVGYGSAVVYKQTTS